MKYGNHNHIRVYSFVTKSLSKSSISQGNRRCGEMKGGELRTEDLTWPKS
jgi:hypothetical protein